MKQRKPTISDHILLEAHSLRVPPMYQKLKKESNCTFEEEWHSFLEAKTKSTCGISCIAIFCLLTSKK